MSDLDLYTIGEVAAILGVSPHTIRAWERRHGIVKPLRTTSRQRRYRGEDVELLREIKRAIDLGGMSLKLAYRTVGQGQHVPEPRLTRPRKRSRAQLPYPSAAGVWRGVADILPEVIVVLSAQGEIVECNVAAGRTFGVTRQRLVGRVFADLVDPFDRAKAVLLYRPQFRTVKGWELNLMTQVGTRLYSFQTWPVLRGDDTSLALVGTEMFTEPSTRPLEETLLAAPATLQPGGLAGPRWAAKSFQRVLDQLPFGLAVTTVGRDPRIVYANARLMQWLGRPRRGMTGIPLGDVVRSQEAAKLIRSVVKTNLGATLRAVRTNPPLPAAERFVNVEFRPLRASNRKVTSVLVLVNDVTAEATWRGYLERLALDRRIERARTAAELANVGVEYLGSSTRALEFAVFIATEVDNSRATYAVAASAAWKGLGQRAAAGRFGAAIREAASTGKAMHVEIADESGTYRLTARPLVVRGPFGATQKLGALAWRSPVESVVAPEDAASIEEFLPRLALAAELLNVRMEARNKALQLDAVVAAASVVPMSGRAGLGSRFLERLGRALRADEATIGRIAGSNFVVEVGFSARGEAASRGSLLPAPKPAEEAYRLAEPVARTAPARPGSRKKEAGSVHELAVPLVLDREVYGVIMLSRTGQQPFGPQAVQLVQTLSGVALLAISLGRLDSFPS